MFRRIADLALTLTAAIALLGSTRPLIAADQPAPPNVIVIMTDDQGYGDLGVHGNEHIRTPHLDRFARDGLQLSRFYCEPVCAPTRASLMTGRNYYRTGVIHTSRGGAKMHGDETTLAEHLAQAGYATGIFGKWHLGDNYPMRPQDQGFSEVLIHKSGGIVQTPDLPNSYFNSLLWHNGEKTRGEGYCTDVFFSAALDFIAQRRGEPFFVYLPTNAPHAPLEIADEYVAPYKALGLDDTTARVYGMVTNIDDNFGRLLARLDELGIRDNTLVVFLTDNGPQHDRYTAGLRDRKGTVYEGGIRVPCFWQGPGVKTGRVVDEPAAHIDLLPTLLAACGVEVEAKLPLDGMNLWPLVAGQIQQLPARTLFFQCHRGLEPQAFHNSAAVERRFKLVANGGTFGKELLDTTQPPVFELFDLLADPAEHTNVATRYPEELARLRKAYEQWFHDVRDSRNFRPGVITIGAEQENPQHLCLYQDATFIDGQQQGWSVNIQRGGTYRISTQLGREHGPGVLHVRFDETHQQRSIESGEAAGEFQLPEGDGLLQIWFKSQAGSQTPADDPTAGDAQIEWLDSAPSKE